MIKTFCIKIVLLINLSIPLNALSSSTVDWSAADSRVRINQIKTAINGRSFQDSDFHEVTFWGATDDQAVVKFLETGEKHDNWREMPLVSGETNIFSLLGRAYVEQFLLTEDQPDYAKAAQYLIWGRLLELSVSASTEEAIAYAFTGSYEVNTALTKDSDDTTIQTAITALQAALEAEATTSSDDVTTTVP